MPIKVLIYLLFFSSTSFALNESVGQFELSDILLRPTFYSEEKTGAQFSLSDSQIRFGWKNQMPLKVEAVIGSSKEVAPSAIYLSSVPDESLKFIEAYVHYIGIYGDFKAGLVPLNFGIESSRRDYLNLWPASQLRSERLVTRRDYGLSYYNAYNRYYSEITVHKGEVDISTPDGNVWLSGRWGWSDLTRLKVQLSGQTGRSDPLSTTEGSLNLGGFDRTQSAHWRIYSLGIKWTPPRWNFLIEASDGERVQRSETNGFETLKFESTYEFKSDWGLGLRHDQFNPNKDLGNDQIFKESLILFIKNDSNHSVISIVGTKQLEEKNQINNDELWLQWRITPFVN